MAEITPGEKERTGKLDRQDYWTGKVLADIANLSPEEAAAKWGSELARLEQLRFIDPFTHLLTRQGLEHQLGIQIAQAREKQELKLAVVMLDLDGFKKINDTKGHDEGNKAITAMVEFVRSNVGQFGITGRYGGDEFAILFPDASLEEGRIAAEIIRMNLKHHMKGKGFPVTSSVGITSLRQDNQNVPTLLKEADDALKTAKNQGKDQVVIFSPQESKAA